jgi:hypothetical protein
MLAALGIVLGIFFIAAGISLFLVRRALMSLVSTRPHPFFKKELTKVANFFKEDNEKLKLKDAALRCSLCNCLYSLVSGKTSSLEIACKNYTILCCSFQGIEDLSEVSCKAFHSAMGDIAEVIAVWKAFIEKAGVCEFTAFFPASQPCSELAAVKVALMLLTKIDAINALSGSRLAAKVRISEKALSNDNSSHTLLFCHSTYKAVAPLYPCRRVVGNKDIAGALYTVARYDIPVDTIAEKKRNSPL